MAVAQLRNIVVDCFDPGPLAEFWSRVLGYSIVDVEDGWLALEPEHGGRPRLAFQRVPEGKATKNRLHLDLWVAEITAAIATAVELGATPSGELVTEETEVFQVMLDPAGNEFCFVHLPGSTGP